MTTYSFLQAISPALPPHCEPSNAFLTTVSSYFHTCIPTELAFVSTTLGTLSIVSWLFAQLPQIYKNYQIGSTSGLSIFFLVEWCLGDLSNLFGALFTGQATWQVIIGAYYCIVDFALVLQWIWYEHLKHGRTLKSVWRSRKRRHHGHKHDGASDADSAIEGISRPSSAQSKPPAEDLAKKDTPHSEPRSIFRTPKYLPQSPAASSPAPSAKDEQDQPTGTPNNRRIHRIQASSSPMPSPKTILFITLLFHVLARASPIAPATSRTITTIKHDESETHPDALQTTGMILSWLSTLLYLGSRLPQLYKNHRRRSTAGLSPTLFIAAFFGNLFYSTSLLTNPYAWHDYPAYGGGGWAGKTGNNRLEWISRAAPFFLGAAGVLILDAAVGLQFLVFGEGKDKEIVVAVLSDSDSESDRGREGPSKYRSRGWRWRRVSGWMRGWVPNAPSIYGGSRSVSPSSSIRSSASSASDVTVPETQTPARPNLEERLSSRGWDVTGKGQRDAERRGLLASSPRDGLLYGSSLGRSPGAGPAQRGEYGSFNRSEHEAGSER